MKILEDIIKKDEGKKWKFSKYFCFRIKNWRLVKLFIWGSRKVGNTDEEILKIWRKFI
jgi:hypothetical protein